MLATFEIGVVWGSLVGVAKHGSRCLGETPVAPAAVHHSSGRAADNTCLWEGNPSSKSKEPQPAKSSLSLSAAVNGLALWTCSWPIASRATSLVTLIDHPTLDQEVIHFQAFLIGTSFARSRSSISNGQSRSSNSILTTSSLSSWSRRTRPVRGSVQVGHPLTALAQDARSVQSSVKLLVLPVDGGLVRDTVDEAFTELPGLVAFADYLAAPDTASSFLLFGASKDGADVEKLMKI